jgi:hypothetical protein
MSAPAIERAPTVPAFKMGAVAPILELSQEDKSQHNPKTPVKMATMFFNKSTLSRNDSTCSILSINLDFNKIHSKPAIPGLL